MNENDKTKIRQTVDFYNGLSRKYDTVYTAYLHHTHQQLLSHLDDLSGERILDISCGTGLLAEHLLNRYTDLDLALNDPADKMRMVAEGRMQGNLSIEFSDKPAEELTVKGEYFDRLICLNSFHYYADQQKAVENMRNALKPGGIIHILDWNLEGWFHLPNAIISGLSHENINTRSVSEIEGMLVDRELVITKRQKWSFWFWKFYMIEAKL
ncbi:class I SAM-dependent methyltransferase [Rhodohalobacter sp. 8-1]|uniref:class I SAM-dependent methyltransferase n=1 Tax=Rhodohalobacter sp. 8-1 TaxID=3131972 RepID=UPI0030EDEC60